MATATATRRIKLNAAAAALPSLRAIILALSDSPPSADCTPVRFDNGVPVYRFRKQIIRCGSFTTADGRPFEDVPATLATWLSDFHAMKLANVPVPVPTKHDDTSADGNRGFVVDDRKSTRLNSSHLGISYA